MEKIKVLLFAANPPGTDRLDLGREVREIDEEIRQGEYRDCLELIFVPGARPVDLLRKLNKEQPHIVHFSGHGSGDATIFLEQEDEDDPNAARPLRSGRDMKRVSEGEILTVRLRQAEVLGNTGKQVSHTSPRANPTSKGASLEGGSRV